MLTSKRMHLNALIESSEGIHLTAYLVNRGDTEDIKVQLRKALGQADEWLAAAMASEARTRFLEPIESLLHDSKILPQMKGNIGLFRNQHIFRVLNIPIEIEETCQVATSFHVKPLLRWIQTDEEFLLVGLENNSAHLYYGTQETLKLVESVYTIDPDAARVTLDRGDVLLSLAGRIEQLTRQTQPKLFIAGEKSQIQSFVSNLSYKNLVRTAVADAFAQNDVGDVCAMVRQHLRVESRKTISRALAEFHFADEGNRVRKNLFQIARAVVQGRVRKLIIADDDCIFGKIDKRSGGLALHPIDLDHEDDDILDDLAQMVLNQGGEVVVASRSEIPMGRPILAILNYDGAELAKALRHQENEALKERFG